MFAFLTKIFKGKNIMSPRQEFMETYGISNNFGLCINNLVVREFNYLLAHYSHSQVDSFDDLDLLLEHYDEIVDRIKIDLLKDDDKLPEAILTVNARTNLRNFLGILETLKIYNEKFGTLVFK